MSTSDLYILNQKSTRHFREFRNGWGSAPILWDYLAGKYLGRSPDEYLLGNRELMKKVWALAGNEDVGACERVALMITFDKAFVPITHLNEASEACLEVGQLVEDGERVNHWPALGQAFADLATMKFGRHARGIVLSCTSVCDCWLEPSDEWLNDAWPIFGS